MYSIIFKRTYINWFDRRIDIDRCDATSSFYIHVYFNLTGSSWKWSTLAHVSTYIHIWIYFVSHWYWDFRKRFLINSNDDKWSILSIRLNSFISRNIMNTLREILFNDQLNDMDIQSSNLIASHERMTYERNNVFFFFFFSPFDSLDLNTYRTRRSYTKEADRTIWNRIILHTF
jgi:hypothetical protein